MGKLKGRKVLEWSHELADAKSDALLALTSPLFPSLLSEIVHIIRRPIE